MKIVGARRMIEIWTEYFPLSLIFLWASLHISESMTNRNIVVERCNLETLRDFYNAEVVH